MPQDGGDLPSAVGMPAPTAADFDEAFSAAAASPGIRRVWVVPNERVSCWRWPAVASLGTRMVTSIPALAMSIPATRSANGGRPQRLASAAPTMRKR